MTTECQHVPETWRRPGRELLCADCRAEQAMRERRMRNAPAWYGTVFRGAVAHGVSWPGRG